MNTCKNYATDGGDTWVVGGKIEFEDGADLEGLPSASKVDPIETPATATAADCATTINSIITALTNAGIMKEE